MAKDGELVWASASTSEINKRFWATAARISARDDLATAIEQETNWRRKYAVHCASVCEALHDASSEELAKRAQRLWAEIIDNSFLLHSSAGKSISLKQLLQKPPLMIGPGASDSDEVCIVREKTAGSDVNRASADWPADGSGRHSPLGCVRSIHICRDQLLAAYSNSKPHAAASDPPPTRTTPTSRRCPKSSQPRPRSTHLCHEYVWSPSAAGPKSHLCRRRFCWGRKSSVSGAKATTLQFLRACGGTKAKRAVVVARSRRGATPVQRCLAGWTSWSDSRRQRPGCERR